jgi:hypothetical protein
MKYDIWINSSDQLGFNMLENVVAMANLGATLKEGYLPIMRFPFSCQMVLETDVAPTPTPSIRIFEESGAELKYVPPEIVLNTASFSLELEEQKPMVVHTKESLASLEFDAFREVCKAVGVKGRDRNLMSRQYLEKVASVVPSSE